MDPAVVRVDDLAHDRRPSPLDFRLVPGRVSGGAERLEDPGAVLRRDSGAVVVNVDLPSVVVRLDADLDPAGAVGQDEANGVTDEFEKSW